MNTYNYRLNEKSPAFAVALLSSFLSGLQTMLTSRDDQNGRSAAHAAVELRRIAGRLSAIAVRECNGYQGWNHLQDVKAQQRDERAETRLRIHAQAIAAEFGLEVYFQTDPRGCPMYLGVGMTSSNYPTVGFPVNGGGR